MDSATKYVSLFVPGLRLFDVKQVRQMLDEQQSLKELDLLYSRAKLEAGTAKNTEASLFAVFGIDVDEVKDLPVGALTDYLVQGDQLEKRWVMRADPVYLQPNRDHLLLMGNAGLDISMQEAERVASDVNDTYHDQSWVIKALTPKQWVIEQDQEENLQTHSLSEATGKNINEYLPKGENEKSWHALMNELQMFLHNHPVNRERQMQGLAVANSIWFWGSGKLPVISASEKPFDQCWSNETVSLALARLNGVPRIDLPTNASDWFKQAITTGKHFLYIENLNDDSLKADPVSWLSALVTFNEQWLAPLVNALKNNVIEELKVIDSNGDCYHLNRQLLNRWWRVFARN